MTSVSLSSCRAMLRAFKQKHWHVLLNVFEILTMELHIWFCTGSSSVTLVSLAFIEDILALSKSWPMGERSYSKRSNHKLRKQNQCKKGGGKYKTCLQHPCPNHVSGRYYSQGNLSTLSHASRERKMKN